MAILLTPDVFKPLAHRGTLWKFQFTIPSVLASSTSSRYALPIDTVAGEILQIRLAYGGDTTTQLLLFTADAATRLSIEEVARTPVVTSCFQQGNLGIIFENTDPVQEPTLYVEVDNLGSVNVTEAITLELILRSMGSRA